MCESPRFDANVQALKRFTRCEQELALLVSDRQWIDPRELPPHGSYVVFLTNTMRFNYSTDNRLTFGIHDSALNTFIRRYFSRLNCFQFDCQRSCCWVRFGDEFWLVALGNNQDPEQELRIKRFNFEFSLRIGFSTFAAIRVARRTKGAGSNFRSGCKNENCGFWNCLPRFDMTD